MAGKCSVIVVCAFRNDFLHILYEELRQGKTRCAMTEVERVVFDGELVEFHPYGDLVA